MPEWATFVGITLVVLALLLVLSHLSRQVLDVGEREGPDPPEQPTARVSLDADEVGPNGVEPVSAETRGTERPTRSLETVDPEDRDGRLGDAGPHEDVELHEDARPHDAKRATRPGTEAGIRSDDVAHTPTDATGSAQFGPGVLLANVALSQGLFAGVLVAAAWYTQIPLDALGVRDGLAVSTAVAVGLGLGLVLYVAAAVGAAFADRAGFDHSEALRRLLAPETTTGWIVLLGGVLPLIAVFEELLFRAALIGVIAAGYGISPWLLAVGSSVLFALGHGIQGPAGVVVTGLLGFVLAAAFVLTNSLLVVVTAHYVVNALEFVVHEGLEIEWTDAIAG